MNFTADELETCLKVLQEVAWDPATMDGHARFKTLVAKVHRQAKKGKRTAVRLLERNADESRVQRTGIVKQQIGVRRLTDSSAIPDSYCRPQRCYV